MSRRHVTMWSMLIFPNANSAETKTDRRAWPRLTLARAAREGLCKATYCPRSNANHKLSAHWAFGLSNCSFLPWSEECGDKKQVHHQQSESRDVERQFHRNWIL
jgi:hypothetical protein